MTTTRFRKRSTPHNRYHRLMGKTGDETAQLSRVIPVAFESGKERTFASALGWPGWTRGGRDEAAALGELLAYGARYRQAIRSARLGFRKPSDLAEFVVTERLTGTATTDFGAPDRAPSIDSQPLNGDELERLVGLLHACWQQLELSVEAAQGKSLRRGPRGGGRTVERIVDHVVEGHYGYLRNIYCRERHEKSNDFAAMVRAVRDADARALTFAISDEMPERGPRGGALWKPRYFVRRSAWHILDHAWEIEDRLEK